MAMRNYRAMQKHKLAACIRDLELGSGLHYRQAVRQHGEFTIAQHIQAAKEAWLINGYDGVVANRPINTEEDEMAKLYKRMQEIMNE